MASQSRFIRLFDEITAADVALVGGKTASLGEMYRALRPRGVLVPNGFAITAEAYRHVLTQAQAWEGLHAALDGVRVDDMEDLARRGRRAREIVCSAEIPADLEDETLGAYRALQRVDVGFDHFKVALSIAVMKMVRADPASSGVIFTVDTESGFRDVVLITGSYGLGENVVQGAVEPDVETPQAERERFCLSDEEALRLATTACTPASADKRLPTTRRSRPISSGSGSIQSA